MSSDPSTNGEIDEEEPDDAEIDDVEPDDVPDADLADIEDDIDDIDDDTLDDDVDVVDETDDDTDDTDDDADDDEENLDELEAEELEMLTDDEASESIAVDEAAELRSLLREEREMDVDPVQASSDEFVCQSCFLLKRRSQLADRRKKICRDCVS